MQDVYVFGQGWRGGEWMRRFGLGLNNTMGAGGVLHVCLRFSCGGVGRGFGPRGGVMLSV